MLLLLLFVCVRCLLPEFFFCVFLPPAVFGRCCVSLDGGEFGERSVVYALGAVEKKSGTQDIFFNLKFVSRKECCCYEKILTVDVVVVQSRSLLIKNCCFLRWL